MKEEAAAREAAAAREVADAAAREEAAEGAAAVEAVGALMAVEAVGAVSGAEAMDCDSDGNPLRLPRMPVTIASCGCVCCRGKKGTGSKQCPTDVERWRRDLVALMRPVAKMPARNQVEKDTAARAAFRLVALAAGVLS